MPVTTKLFPAGSTVHSGTVVVEFTHSELGQPAEQVTIESVMARRPPAINEKLWFTDLEQPPGNVKIAAAVLPFNSIDAARPATALLPQVKLVPE